MSHELWMPKTTHRKMMLAREHYRLWWGAFSTLSMSELKSEIEEDMKYVSVPPVQDCKITKFDIAVHEYLKNHEKDELCAACGVYKRHAKPPRDWTMEDKVYCCLHCRDTKGTGHGKRCNKCVIVDMSPKTEFDEDNGY